MDRRTLVSWICATTLALWAVGVAAQLAAPQFLPGQPMVVGQQVLMIWNPVPGAAGYAVFLDGKELARPSANQFMAELPAEPGRHRYQVAAVTADGALGERSEPGVIQIRQLAVPANLKVQADPAAEALGLIWDRVPGAVIYNVYRAAGDGDWSLVASVQQESYKDGAIRGGTSYRYRVTARDVTGRESPPSPVASAAAPEVQRSATERRLFRALPTTEVLAIHKLDEVSLEQVSHLSVGPDGNLWLVTPKTRQIHAVDEGGIPLLTFGPYVSDATGYTFIPQKLDFGPDGNLYVTDALNSALACIDPAGDLLWTRGIPTPPPTAVTVWRDFPERYQTLPSTPSSVACRADEIWVTDQRFQLVYRMDYEGRVQGYLTHYQTPTETLRFLGIGEILLLDGDRALLTFPLSHRAVVLDASMNLVAELGVDVRGYVGGFVGIHGASPWGPGQVLLTDPAVGSLQIFDSVSGQYRFHISGPSPRPDPVYDQRADLPLHKPNMAVRDPDGRIWVYDARSRSLRVLRQTGEVTPPLEEP